MRDDPRENVKWMQQQLMDAEEPRHSAIQEDDLMARVDALLEDFSEEEQPIGNFSHTSRGAHAERSHIYQQFDPSSAVLTKTKKQLHREEKQKKQAEKKASVNRSVGGLFFLAILECIGILAILGWWLQ